MRLAETLDKSKDQIRRLLNKLKRTNDITTTRIGCATLVRLINYNKYQGFEYTTPDPTATCPPDESHFIADYPPTTEERKQGNNVNNEKKLVGREIFKQKRTGGGLYAHIINEIQTLTKPASGGLLWPHQSTKKRGRHRKNLPVAGVLR